MRGSYEIVHDCDFSINVEHGIATTNKNRFKSINQQYVVFNSIPIATNTNNQSSASPTPKTIEEQIAILIKKEKEAVRTEDYERAARLRDKIAKLKNKGSST